MYKKMIVRYIDEVINCGLMYCIDSSIVREYFFCFQAEDGIRDLVRSRGLGDVYKRQVSILLQLRLYRLSSMRNGT